MKKMWVILFVLLLPVLLLAGCAGDDDDDAAADDDNDNDATPDDDDDNDTTPVDDDDDTTPGDDDDDDDDNDNDTPVDLPCTENLPGYYACDGWVPSDQNPMSESEAIADCEAQAFHDAATWSCMLDCVAELEADCSNYIDDIVCVPLCLFYQGPVPEDCTPAFPDVQVCGHRGASFYAPENTIPSFEAAADQGAAFIELDVRSTLDGALICMHDSDVDRTTNDTGEVSSLTLAEIQALEIDDSNYGDAFPGLGVPTFAEALAAIHDTGARVDIDTKTDDVAAVVQAVVDADMMDEVMAYCGSQGEVDAFLAVDPTFPVMPAPDSPEELLLFLANYDVDYMELSGSSNTPAGIAALHAADVLAFQDALGSGDVLLMLTNSVQGWWDMLDSGLDIIQTDLPHALVEFIDNACE
jgi:glycerophosphoryl diester phosphodiesterase